MILIASAAYVNSEFQTEFGRLPPALLPVGNRRIFERQIATLQTQFPNEPVFLSLPDSYALSSKDEIVLNRLGVTVLRSPETLKLADAIMAALTQANHDSGILRLLHGDTWLCSVPPALDVIGIVETNEDYSWEIEDVNPVSESVWCGYFAFSNSSRFFDALSASGDFTRAVRAYDADQPMARLHVDGWHDFGHVNTYFQSRTRLTTQRSFNELQIADGCVRKSGTPHAKIRAEENWFKELPMPLRVYAPQLIGGGNDDVGRPYYVLEYLPLPPLNEVYVHGRNPVFYWDRIFTLCASFFATCRTSFPDGIDPATIEAEASAMAGAKTWDRLAQFVESTDHPGLDVPSVINGVRVPSLRTIVADCQTKLASTRCVPGVLHGDLCLSNILFDSRSDRIKVIDPRGLNADGKQTIVGDLRYDLAKLTHSIVGLYDHIIAGAFTLRAEMGAESCVIDLDIHVDERTGMIQKIFLDREFPGGLTAQGVMPLTILLFLSMLPLHADDPCRQTALLGNALRLYATFKSA